MAKFSRPFFTFEGDLGLKNEEKRVEYIFGNIIKLIDKRTIMAYIDTVHFSGMFEGGTATLK
ncbi:MAG: hypothetical protein COV72_08130 [Candidatus Omnitrophica bacterium CG11_big_fil_rev_8_21_14_0_20_42_13]|uniref:Uncharacterized protein n=1 Tax=Candidatus Ghiorseimicrobium undicola TaxID=1974746 RepID=A0A2H0LVV9_9BACT|nr:MAG: hypothetical protein COV72_08130 [Candidatus Omnitrophica bacterium CG11_big_fil_rev_8_21_14_0_20_42_13]